MSAYFVERPPKFELGKVIWPELPPHLADDESDVDHESFHDWLLEQLLRHHAGEWGSVDEETKQANALALEHGGRLVSKHLLSLVDETYVEIVTEPDRSVTRIIVPADL